MTNCAPNRSNTLRNIGILAHIDAGKTTTTERMLFYTGINHKLGEVHDGNATMDWMSQEQERGITITAAATAFDWLDTKINLIDTPGHVDFTVEVERCLNAIEGVVLVIDGKEGVEAQTEIIWQKVKSQGCTPLVFINKLDRVGASFEQALQSLHKQLGVNAVALQLPLGNEKDFEGLIDLVEMKAVYFDGTHGKEVRLEQIPPAFYDQALSARDKLLESLSEFNDTLLTAYLENQPIAPKVLRDCIREQTILGHIIPVFCGSAYKNKGIQPLLDAIVFYLPGPKPGKVLTDSHALPDHVFSGQVFKVMTDPYVGKLHYLRIFSGTLHVGDVINNASKDKKERIAKLLHMHANHRQEIECSGSGDLVAIVGLKHTHTGDSLCALGSQIHYCTPHFSKPVISMAIEPQSQTDQEKLKETVDHLLEEDPTLTSHTDADTGQMLVTGMGELHLEVIKDRIIQDFHLGVRFGKPQVAYRETISASILYNTTHHILIATKDNPITLHFKLGPEQRGQGNVLNFSDAVKNLPSNLFTVCQEGLELALLSGPIGGYPLVDIGVYMEKIDFIPSTHAEIAIKSACAIGLGEAIKKGTPQLLEPISLLEISVPLQYVGDVIQDLQGKQAIILAIKDSLDRQIIKAQVALSKVFGYATTLRSQTQGRGHHTLTFSHYDTINPT